MSDSDLARLGRASGSEILRLSRRDRAAAVRAVRELPPEAQAQACQDLRPEVRHQFLMLLDSPEKVVPLLPEMELCATIRSGGMSEAAWLLELATAEQRQACFDLDCWSGERIELDRVTEWIDGLIEAGRPTLVTALEQLDPELSVLALAGLTEVAVLSRDDEPPDGFFTEDGVVYFGPRNDGSFSRVKEIAQATFSEDQPIYWRLVYGLIYESMSEAEEWALRWRQGRLLDLGFPGREQAMRAYSPLAIEALPALPAEPGARPERTGELVETAELPAELAGTRFGEALRELPAQAAADALAGVLSLANALAVADRLRLSEPESIPTALRKAVRGLDRGLAEVAAARRAAAGSVLEHVPALELFRIGATLDPELRPPPFTPEEVRQLAEDLEGEEPG